MKTKRAIVASAALLLAAGGVLATSEAASASQYLGGVSVSQGCVYQHGTASTAIVAWNVYGWRCAYYGGWNVIYQGVNLSQECAREYGGGAYAAYTNYYNPYSWGCYR